MFKQVKLTFNTILVWFFLLIYLDKFRQLRFIKIKKKKLAKVTTAAKYGNNKKDAMQTERFVQSTVIKSDNLLKIDTYAKLTQCKNNSPCKSDAVKKLRVKLIGWELTRVGTYWVGVVSGLELSGFWIYKPWSWIIIFSCWISSVELHLYFSVALNFFLT